jgi:hypothetical protein
MFLKKEKDQVSEMFLKHGCTNPGSVVFWTTEFVTLLSNAFGTCVKKLASYPSSGT